jgi:lipid-A-disaccharide synthase
MSQEMELDVLLVSAPSLQLGNYELPSQISLVKENRYAAMKACDLMLVASGTSTLEAAILGTPLFIVYKVGDLSWQLGKLLVRVPYYGLVNWIAGKKCIPEYIQGRMDSEILARNSIAFLKDSQEQAKMKRELAEIVTMLGPPGAIERAVDAILARLPRINTSHR